MANLITILQHTSPVAPAIYGRFFKVPKLLSFDLFGDSFEGLAPLASWYVTVQDIDTKTNDQRHQRHQRHLEVFHVSFRTLWFRLDSLAMRSLIVFFQKKKGGAALRLSCSPTTPLLQFSASPYESPPWLGGSKRLGKTIWYNSQQDVSKGLFQPGSLRFVLQSGVPETFQAMSWKSGEKQQKKQHC